MGWEIVFLAWVVGMVVAVVKFYDAISAIVDHRNGIDQTAHGDD